MILCFVLSAGFSHMVTSFVGQNYLSEFASDRRRVLVRKTLSVDKTELVSSFGRFWARNRLILFNSTLIYDSKEFTTDSSSSNDRFVRPISNLYFNHCCNEKRGKFSDGKCPKIGFLSKLRKQDHYRKFLIMRQGKVEEKIILGDLSQEISGNEMLSMLKNEEFSLFVRPHTTPSPHTSQTLRWTPFLPDWLFSNGRS
jgi:hypothetical protein